MSAGMSAVSWKMCSVGCFSLVRRHFPSGKGLHEKANNFDCLKSVLQEAAAILADILQLATAGTVVDAESDQL
jgi:hypothetical protein